MKAAADLRLALDRVAFASSLGLDPDPWQERLLRSTSQRVLLNCSRQSGKSTMSGVIALHRALYPPGSLVLCLAPSERQSKELFAKVSDSYRRLRGPRRRRATGSSGCACPRLQDRGLAGLGEDRARVLGHLAPDSGRGGKGGGRALLRRQAHACGLRRLPAHLSTPYGKRGVFHAEWTGGRGWDHYEVPAAECPRISEEFLEEERETLPPWVFRQEYECSFEETEDAVFTLDMIERAVTSEVKPLFGAG